MEFQFWQHDICTVYSFCDRGNDPAYDLESQRGGEGKRSIKTGGKEIASKLAHDLGIHCYENRILTLASQMSGLDEQLFTEVNERLRKDKYSGLLRGLPRSLKPKAEETFVSDDPLFATQKQMI